ncbi:MAG: glycosyl hydrolase family 65 protein [Eubacteriales bacterium]|nr:glycosyl hydrolase family 65 protein [Eubacteriales bacterium]MDD3198800.1 glycosyl hydrolase family 65 protein [Eubacteriales bacterium]MDD4122375.1 glycosyl hydrolase family 65 protein [Eubacteriales bacterium]MDD4629750.1 glycosyl hydrolase family 65 protein [Eubacteriales bacterium]
MSNRGSIYSIDNLVPDQYQISLNETIFHNANGYIGVRYDFEEGYPDEYYFVRSQYINGFYDHVPVRRSENLYGLVTEKQTMLNVADTQSIKLWLEDEEFSMYRGTLLESRLFLDMVKGITVRHVVWRSPKGKVVELKIIRMASFHQLSLFTIDYEVLPLNFSGNIMFESGHNGNVYNYCDPHDPRMANEQLQYLTPHNCEIKEGASYITSGTSRSEQEVCSCVKNILSQKHTLEYDVNGNRAICRINTRASEGKKIKLKKYSVFCDSIRSDNPKMQAEVEMGTALAVPLQHFYFKQKEYLADYWNNCFIRIDDKYESNLSLRYSLFQLIQSVGKDRYCNIAPKGLSGDGYEGHYFWDSEMYIHPFFTITNPSVSKILLEYRYETLDLARENARILGHKKGALYPWRTIMGKECSGYYPSGSAQYHINGDIAYTVIAYYLATKDLPFLLVKGAEIIWETARLWMDTGNYYKGEFHINDVTGPDEYTCIVNNNYYTNLVAQYNLSWAVKIYKLLRPYSGFRELTQKLDLRESEILDFQNAADHMYLPYDEELKINPQDDSFLKKQKWDPASIPDDHFPLLLHYHPLHLFRHQICKQADTVMAHFILEDAQSEETMYNSYQFYENITIHDSSLSYCIFSIMASRLGMEEKAYAYYEIAARMDLTDAYGNTDDGLHIANMGGIYMTIVYGFAGFRLKENGISLSPILPAKWDGYRFKIVFEGSRIRVEVKNDTCLLHLENGAPKEITIYQETYLLKNTLKIRRPPRNTNVEAPVKDNEEVHP